MRRRCCTSPIWDCMGFAYAFWLCASVLLLKRFWIQLKGIDEHESFRNFGTRTGSFPYLRILNFMWNNIRGSIPKEIGNLTILELFLLYRFKDSWKSTLALFRWAETRPGFDHLSEAYNLMVDILGKARQFDQMRQLAEEMRQRNSVTMIAVGKMMRRYAGDDRWTDVVKLFDDLGTFGLERNTESMNLMLDALCKEKQVDQARQIFMELKSHIAPNANTFNIFIHGWCIVNHVEEAYWTIQEMKGNGFHPCVISYSTVIQSYCQQANYIKVYELLDEMEAQGCAADVITYTSIMSSVTKSEQYDEALRITERMKLIGCKPDTLFYNAFLRVLGRAGQVREAVRVFEEEMPENGIPPRHLTCSLLLDELKQNGVDHAADKVEGYMKQTKAPQS